MSKIHEDLEPIFEKIRADIESRPELKGSPEHVRQAVVAEQFLRHCQEVAMALTIPFNTDFLDELVPRTTAYLFTVYPDEITLKQGFARMIENLPGAISRKLSLGHSLRGKWSTKNEKPPIKPI